MRINKQNDYKTENSTKAVFTVQWKWLVGSVVALVMLFAVLGGLYLLQTKDQTEFRIKIFKDAEEDGRWRDGIQQLMLFQREKTDDMEVITILAEAFDENGIMPSDWNNAIRYYQLLLSQATTPEKKLHVLERILDNQRKLQDLDNMSQTVVRVFEIAPENPLAWKCLVFIRSQLLQSGNYQPRKGEPEYFDQLAKKAMDLNPDDPELVSLYARLLRTGVQSTLACTSPAFRDISPAVRAKEADQLMEQFARSHLDDSTALLTHYEYRTQYRLLDPNAENIDEQLQKIMDMEPNNLSAMMYVGMFLEQKVFRMKAELDEVTYREKLDEAAGKFREIIAKSPGNAMGYVQLASLYETDGQFERQIEVLEQANKATQTNDLNVIISLSLAYLDQKDTKNADRVIRQIYDWIERHRGASASAETVRSSMLIATMLEGRSLAITGDAAGAIKKFRSVFEPTIPRKIDIRLIYDSLLLYAQLLIDSVNPDSAVDIYQQTTRFLDMETQGGNIFNFLRINRVFTLEIMTLMQLGQSVRLESTVSRYVEYLQKELRQQPDNQMARFSLVTTLYRKVMMQPEEQRDWAKIDEMLTILRANRQGVIPPWQVDFLQADVTWEQLGRSPGSVEEVLIPLRMAENQYNGNELFLISMEEIYRKYNALKDCERVLDQLRTFPNGEAYWYLIKAKRADDQGNQLEVKRLIGEALEKLPNEQKALFLSLQESMEMRENLPRDGIAQRRLALEQLREFAAKNPTVQALFRLALMELDNGNTKAVAELELRLQKMEGDEGTLFVLIAGERLLQEAVDGLDPKIEMARIRQRTLLAKRPNWEYTYLLAADIEDKVGNEIGVIDALKKAIEAGNQDPSRHRDLIELYRRNNQETEADVAFQRSVRLFPNIMARSQIRFAPPYQAYYMEFLRTIRREDVDAAKRVAEKWLERAKTAQVDSIQIAIFNTEIAQGFMGLEQMDAAEDFFKKAAETGGETILPLAKFYAITGNIQKALEMIYAEMKKSQKPETFLLSVLGLTRDYEFDTEWMKPFDEFVLGSDPSKSQNIGEVYRYVQYLMVRKMEDKILPYFRRMYELDTTNVMTMNDLAYLIAFQKTEDTREANFKEAISLIDKAIESDKNNAMLIDTKGLIVMAQGNPEQAATLFTTAVELARHSVIYRLHLAVALLRADIKDQAKEEFGSIRKLLVPQIEMLPESNRNYTQELLDAFPDDNQE